MPTLKEKGEAIIAFVGKYAQTKAQQEARIQKLEVQGLMMLQGLDPSDKDVWAKHSGGLLVQVLERKLKQLMAEHRRLREEKIRLGLGTK